MPSEIRPITAAQLADALALREANRLRDRAYAAIHEGDAHEWAA